MAARQTRSQRIEQLRQRERARRRLDRERRRSTRRPRPSPIIGPSGLRTKFNGNKIKAPRESVLILGVMQSLCGLGTIILGIVSIATKTWGYSYASGFWSGVFFVAAGIFGILSKRTNANKSVIAFMVLSSISAMLALILIVLSAVGMASDYTLFTNFKMYPGISFIVHSLIIVIGLVEIVCAIMSGVLGCRKFCDTWDYEQPSEHAQREYYPARISVRRSRSSNRSSHRRTVEQYLDTTCDIESNIEAVPIVLPPYTSPGNNQQIAILVSPYPDHDFPLSGDPYALPAGDYMMQTPHMLGGFGPYMYVMQGASSEMVPQPGSQDIVPREPRDTPPPSYSQIDVRYMCKNDGESDSETQDCDLAEREINIRVDHAGSLSSDESNHRIPTDRLFPIMIYSSVQSGSQAASPSNILEQSTLQNS